jgi:hypothetical protein
VKRTAAISDNRGGLVAAPVDSRVARSLVRADPSQESRELVVGTRHGTSRDAGDQQQAVVMEAISGAGRARVQVRDRVHLEDLGPAYAQGRHAQDGRLKT